jgi:CIC family chloride channel protein
LGAGLGSLVGTTLHYFHLAQNLPVAAVWLGGNGKRAGATVHSPLLSLILILEISGNYSLMPALMLGCVTATLVAAIAPESIYIEPLRRKVWIRGESQHRRWPHPKSWGGDEEPVLCCAKPPASAKLPNAS